MATCHRVADEAELRDCAPLALVLSVVAEPSTPTCPPAHLPAV